MPTILIQSARQIHFLVLIHLVDIVTYKNYPSHFGIGHTSDRFNGQHKNLQACPLRKYLLSLVVLTINNELSQQIYNEKRPCWIVKSFEFLNGAHEHLLARIWDHNTCTLQGFCHQGLYTQLGDPRLGPSLQDTHDSKLSFLFPSMPSPSASYDEGRKTWYLCSASRLYEVIATSRT